MINAGSDVINKLLDGGYENDVLTAIYGPAGSGKTTMCMLAARECIKNGKKVIFIDSEGGFSIVRLNQISRNDPNIMEQIFLLKPTSFEEQSKTIRNIKQMISERIGMIILDTISMHYRIEVAKHEQHIKQINAELGVQISYLSEIARKHNIPILITNQVYADFEEKDNVRLVGGDIILYGCKSIIEIKKYNNKRKAIIKKARSLPENKEVIFSISEEGFSESEVQKT